MSISPGKSEDQDLNMAGAALSCPPPFLLTNDFDKQIKLVEDSMTASRGDVNRTVKEEKGERRAKAQNNKTPGTQNSQKRQLKYTNSSRIFRYDAADEEDGPELKLPTPFPIHPPAEGAHLPEGFDSETESRSKMLMSWYMAGYHTGYYDAMLKYKRTTN